MDADPVFGPKRGRRGAQRLDEALAAAAARDFGRTAQDDAPRREVGTGRQTAGGGDERRQAFFGVNPAQIADGKRAAAGGPDRRRTERRAIHRVRHDPDNRRARRRLNADRRGDGFAGGLDPRGAAIPAHLALGKAVEVDHEQAGVGTKPPDEHRQGDGVGHEDVARRQPAEHAPSPEGVEHEVLPQAAALVPAVDANQPHAVHGFGARRPRPAARDDRHLVAAPRVGPAEPPPHLFHRAARDRRHRQEEPHDDRDPHRFATSRHAISGTNTAMQAW
ncbi:MAG TPA: hypothetical protein VEB66_13780 [Opitutaceae bacterium]|nr:hypothetical protein [Opitutaceae bacterium]